MKIPSFKEHLEWAGPFTSFRAWEVRHVCSFSGFMIDNPETFYRSTTLGWMSSSYVFPSQLAPRDMSYYLHSTYYPNTRLKPEDVFFEARLLFAPPYVKVVKDRNLFSGSLPGSFSSGRAR